MAAINQKITAVINDVLMNESVQQDGGLHDTALVSEQAVAQSTTPRNAGAKNRNRKKNHSSQQTQDLKRDRPDERSPDNQELKKVRDDENTGQLDISENLLELNTLKSRISDLTAQDQQPEQSPFFKTLMTNLQPLIIREVQKAFDDVISRLDAIEKNIKRMDIQRLNGGLERVTFLENKVDSLEQYSRRQQLIFEGVPESNDENTDLLIITECKKVNVNIEPLDLHRSHRLGKRHDGRPRPIIAHFLSYRHKRETVQAAKKDLFDKLNSAKRDGKRQINLAIRVKECLTPKRAGLFRQIMSLKERKLIKSVWTDDGNILIRKLDTDRLVRIATESEYREFINRL